MTRATSLLLLVALVAALGCAPATDPGAAVIGSDGPRSSEPPARQYSAGPTRAMILRCSPEREVEFGVVPQGGRKEGVIWLTNPTDDAIEVTEIRTSCECVKITSPLPTIPPRERVSATIVLDLGLEPESSGNLAVEVEGFTDSGQTAFAFNVLVQIADSDK